jgi:hypothetical protein
MNDDERLVVAYTTDDPAEADILCEALRNEGIPCQVTGSQQGGLAGLAISEVQLLVHAADLERAQAYLEQTEFDQDEDDDRE